MATASSARLKGDDYQHLYGWYSALELKMPTKCVQSVTVENPEAGAVDDVTIRYKPDARVSDKFYQIKFHVDHRSSYSGEYFVSQQFGTSTLLERFYQAWKKLNAEVCSREFELILISNWGLEPKFGKCIDGQDGSLKECFLASGLLSDTGKIRKAWERKLKAGDNFESFVRCLRFKTGTGCTTDLEQRVAERMDFLGLRSDRNAVLTAIGIVRNWVKSGQQDVDLNILEHCLKEHELHQSDNTERYVTVHLTTIKTQRFLIEPDYELDWREHFIGGTFARGHQLKEPTEWNTQLLPELQRLASKIDNDSDIRLIRARGLARLSAWFAFGCAFPEVGRYTIEVDQAGESWRSDAQPSEDFKLVVVGQSSGSEGEFLGGSGSTVAVGLSITGSLCGDVRAFLAQSQEEVGALLLLAPNRELGRTALRSAADVVALADEFKRLARAFVKHWNARRLLLFYFGPFSGACFIGHKLNAIVQEVQIMEDQQPGYAPSFLLR